MSRDARKPIFGVSDQVHTNHAVQSQKMTSGLKFLIDCASYVAKTKALNSCAVIAQLICTFVIAYAKRMFSHAAAHIITE